MTQQRESDRCVLCDCRGAGVEFLPGKYVCDVCRKELWEMGPVEVSS